MINMQGFMTMKVHYLRLQAQRAALTSPFLRLLKKGKKDVEIQKLPCRNGRSSDRLGLITHFYHLPSAPHPIMK